MQGKTLTKEYSQKKAGIPESLPTYTASTTFTFLSTKKIRELIMKQSNQGGRCIYEKNRKKLT